MSEHACPLPSAAEYLDGQLYLCGCGRLYVRREVWAGDCMSDATRPTWERVTKRRWWR